jgi:hypothetical protein
MAFAAACMDTDFVYFDNRTNQWQPETVDDTLRVRRLPSGLQV